MGARVWLVLFVVGSALGLAACTLNFDKFETTVEVDSSSGGDADGCEQGGAFCADTGGADGMDATTDGEASDASEPDDGSGDAGKPDARETCSVDAGSEDDGGASRDGGPDTDAGSNSGGSGLRSCYTGPAGTEGVGRCRAGTQQCESGVWGACEGEVTPTTEVCNGKDDDCDGTSDESLADCTKRAAGETCTSGDQCRSNRCLSGENDATCAHRMFVTAATFSGALGGLSGADAKCSDAAAAAGWTGEWRAVLSTDATDAKSRVTVTAPIVNAQGDVVADGAADLWDGTLSNSVQFDATGNAQSGSVWTGTNTSGEGATGVVGATFCSTWSSGEETSATVVGKGDSATETWVEAETDDCSTLAHLYCIDGQ